jgi:DNA-binding NarL/FixJ family response regulator
MRVVVADSNPGVRRALRLVLTEDLGLQVVGEVSEGADLWTEVQRTRPDLLVLDWDIAGAEAAALLARLRAPSPGLRVIALSGHSEVRRLAIAAGADAWISKADSPAQVRATLQAVARGPRPHG